MAGNGITLTYIKHIIKVIRFLQYRWVLLKGTAEKSIRQEGGLLNFSVPLIKVGLPLMKNVLTHYHIKYT